MPYNGALDAFTKIFNSEGARGLWRGLAPALLMAVPSTAFYFTIYDYLKKSVQRWQTLSPDNPLAPGSTLATASALPPLLAGITARTITPSLLSPLELLRTRAQTAGQAAEPGKPASSPSMLSIMRAELASGGLPALFRGLTATLWRDVPFSAVYWVMMEHLRGVSQRALGIAPVEDSDDDGSLRFAGSMLQESERRWLSSFIAGATGGAIAAVLTHPFDVIKTRRHMTMYGFPGSSFGDANNLNRIHTLRRVVAEEGPRGVFIGMGPRVFKIMPSCAIMISTYDVVKGFLKRRREKIMGL